MSEPGAADREHPDREPDPDPDSEAVERAFAELVAGYHLTADRPEVAPPPPRPSYATFEPPAPEPAVGAADDIVLLPGYDDPDEGYEPDPVEPLPKPAWPVLIGWLGMGYAVLVMLAVVVGIDLPRWAAWLGLLGFVGGFGILVARLPRERPPGSGDGAVV